MLADRCHCVFQEFVDSETQSQGRDIDDKDLIAAFEEGTIAAKSKLDTGYCPYSASKEPSNFLAWLAGFRCCSGDSVRDL